MSSDHKSLSISAHSPEDKLATPSQWSQCQPHPTRTIWLFQCVSMQCTSCKGCPNLGTDMETAKCTIYHNIALYLDYQVLQSEARERPTSFLTIEDLGRHAVWTKESRHLYTWEQLERPVAEHTDLGLHSIDGQCLRVWISCDRPSGNLKILGSISVNNNLRVLSVLHLAGIRKVQNAQLITIKIKVVTPAASSKLWGVNISATLAFCARGKSRRKKTTKRDRDIWSGGRAKGSVKFFLVPFS